ncbi:uncharacterized protein LOC126786132 [Argentina anserina]|uniref:uncharacterized protein LOC126786132 n=1 Tax=Argentina anserina TaxID=57926 RepID=UPI0021762AD9|nr:uncharacterized protein LOC126786132 [Potentilla anserina]
MTIASLRARNTHFFSRFKLLLNHQHRLAHAFSECPQSRPKMVPESVAEAGFVDMSKWRKIDSREFGISRGMIPPPSYQIIRILRAGGFEAYLVGGCVRDLILKRVPKDYDVITTANLNQIKKHFHRAQIVGRRFPICMVSIKGSVVEVSSFDTVSKDCDTDEVTFSQMPKGCDRKDFIRWRNSMHRDFTINSLFFDPLSNKIYDYADGMKDLKSLKLRSLVPAKVSFKEDCARILRGLRIAARLRLSISKQTEKAIHKLSSSILKLATSRIMMEMNYMLSYGAAEQSLGLLWRFNLLRLILPIHAAYLDQQSIRKIPQNSIMLMKLFSNLDKVVTVDRPSDCSLWIALLAFHMALASHPQDALVVYTFASILYQGKCQKGLKFARDNAQVIVDYLPEISISSACKSEKQLKTKVSQFASLVLDSIAALTATESLVERMSMYPESPCSGLVFVPDRTGQNVAEIFRVLAGDIESYNKERRSYEIDYALLQKGFLHETSFVLGKIILETMSNGILKGEEVIQEEDYRHLEKGSIKEICHMGKKRSVKLDLPELKLGFAKKHKLIEKKRGLLEQEMGIEQPEVVEQLFPQAELISDLRHREKKQKLEIDVQSKRKMHSKMENKQQCVPADKAMKLKPKTVKKNNLNQQETVDTENIIADIIDKIPKDSQVRDKEKKQQCVPSDKAMKLEPKTIKKNNLNQQETFDTENILADIIDKIPKDSQVRDKENGSLSSLFSGEKIQKLTEDTDKREKSSQPRLSSLFR